MRKVLLLCLLLLFVGCDLLPGPELVVGESYITPIQSRGWPGPDAIVKFNVVQTAKAGDDLFNGANYTPYKKFHAREMLTVPGPEGMGEVALTPVHGWFATHRIADRDLLLKAPEDISPSGFELAVRIDESGNVVGDHPWYDLKTKRAFVQDKWGNQPRRLFRIQRFEPPEGQAVQVRVKYASFVGCGEEAERNDGSCVGRFEMYQRKYDESQFKKTLTIIGDDRDTIGVWDVSIQLVSLTEKGLRYRVVKTR